MINERQMMQMLEIVNNLKRKYTSCEVGAITYEKAGSLMDDVVYVIGQGVHSGSVVGDDTDMHAAYRAGLDIIADKMKSLQEKYNEIVENFEDYGCSNYKDTVLKGLREFFLRYDPETAPREDIITYDYPLMKWSTRVGRSMEHGVSFMEDYIRGLEIEILFLNNFDANYVRECIPDYFMGNICEEVLFNTVKERCEEENAPIEDIIMNIAKETGMMQVHGGGAYLFGMTKGIEARLQK